MDNNTCTINGCDNPSKVKGWCNPHYKRWHRTGDPGPADLPKHRTGCIVEGCEGKHSGLGYCYDHRRRFRIYGDPLVRGTAGCPPGQDHPLHLGDDVKYDAVHRRLRVIRGRAPEHDCHVCGRQARQWAYTHSSKNEKYDTGRPYSTDLNDYVPMCGSCHVLFDHGKLTLLELAE